MQIPSQKTLEIDPPIQMDSQTTLADLRCCDTLPRRLHRLSSIGTIPTGATSTPWTSILNVPVNASKTLFATFLNPMSARRYVLMLDLNIEGLSHGTLALQIPIRIIHDPSQTSDRSRRNLCGQEQESLSCQSLEGMASMSFQDGQETGSGGPIKPPPYAKHRGVSIPCSSAKLDLWPLLAGARSMCQQSSIFSMRRSTGSFELLAMIALFPFVRLETLKM